MHPNRILSHGTLTHSLLFLNISAAWRPAVGAIRPVALASAKNFCIIKPERSFKTLTSSHELTIENLVVSVNSLRITGNTPNILSQPVRTVTKFSLQSGKRKSVRCVPNRFFRLHWGIWIRTKCGRHKKLHKKRLSRRRRLRQHVFTNATQSWLLDSMVTKFWKRPKYYIDDPYEPYHTRDFGIGRTKPQPMQERVESNWATQTNFLKPGW